VGCCGTGLFKGGRGASWVFTHLGLLCTHKSGKGGGGWGGGGGGGWGETGGAAGESMTKQVSHG